MKTPVVAESLKLRGVVQTVYGIKNRVTEYDKVTDNKSACHKSYECAYV